MKKANYSVAAIHGDKKQFERQDAINSFLKGTVPILLATDVASRGLDFPKVSYVFNYDMPKNIEDYVHRIGRTGRCGNKGEAISFIDENTRTIIRSLYELFQKQNQEIPEWFSAISKTALSYPGRSFNRNNKSSESSFLQKKRRPDDDSSRDKFNSGTSWDSNRDSSNQQFNHGKSSSGTAHNSDWASSNGWGSSNNNNNFSYGDKSKAYSSNQKSSEQWEKSKSHSPPQQEKDNSNRNDYWGNRDNKQQSKDNEFSSKRSGNTDNQWKRRQDDSNGWK